MIAYSQLICASALIAAPLATAPVQAQSPASAEEASTPEARRAVHAFGRCVADKRAAKAYETLLLDFRTDEYRKTLRSLALQNKRCLGKGKLQSAGVLFAGGMAEQLLATRFAPTEQVLGRAAASAAPTPRTPSDAMAICVVRTAPGDVTRLFATEVATPAEEQAAGVLAPVVGRCAGDEVKLTASVSGLRAVLATAALRTAAATTDKAG